MRHLVLVMALAALGSLAGACPAPPTAPATTTATTTATKAALCEHKVPADLCAKCHPELVPVFKSQGDWCAEHGVPESQCFACNPGLSFEGGVKAAGSGDWCQEHGVPESKCTKCHPALVAKFVEAGDYCREHGFPESVCPICHPELPARSGHTAPTFPDANTKVRLASAETVKDAGIATIRVQKRPWSKTLDVTGQLEFDGNAQAQISAKDEARVLEVLVDVGDRVRAGQALVVLASAGAGADRAQLQAATARVEAARAALQRLEKLQGITAQKNVDEARASLAAAEADQSAALASLKASGADTTTGSAMGTGGRLVLTSPLAGTVVARNVAPGRTATAGDVLVQVADTAKLWAVLDVPEVDSGDVREGQRVELRFEGLRAEPRDGKIARVGASIDPHSRTLRARVDVENADGVLKAGLFLRARVTIADAREAVLVPRVSVQRAEGKSVVFVVQEPGVYEPRAVEVASGDAEVVEISSGLSPGDEIVTTGAFLLKTEILKDLIGAGCCDDD